MPRNQERLRSQEDQVSELCTRWYISNSIMSRDSRSESCYAERYVYYEDGGKSKQVLYYEEGDGWRLHWWDSKGEGPEDGDDWNTMVFAHSFPMDFKASKSDIETVVKEFTDKTDPGNYCPGFPGDIPPWKGGYRGSLFGKEAEILKGPPLKSRP